MSLEEKFEALIKNVEATVVINEEIKNQNAYLRCPLGEPRRQKRRSVVSSSSSPSSDQEERVE